MEVMMDVVVEVMITVVDVGMITVVVVTLVPWEWIVMMVAKGMKWLAKVTLQVEIMVLNMVVDLVMECIIIDLWTCQKGKGKGKYVCVAPP
jgi:hypothetical protein